MDNIKIATSGYSYEDWREVFYPPELPKADYIKYYSLFYPFTELNFPYYSMPTARGLAGMADRTPEGFLFSIKAHKSLTHERGADWRKDAADYKRAVEALAERNRLAAVLVQLPFRFHYDPDNRSYLAALLRELEPLPCAVEFRNDEWYSDRVFDELDRRGAGSVVVDRPDLERLPPLFERVTGGLGYIRFHGRNASEWWTGDNASRYDYLYSPEELASWVPRLKRMAKGAKILLVAFNNHAKGQAIKNSGELKELLFPA